MHRIQTFNAISELGLEKLPKDNFDVGPDLTGADAILLRSFKLEAASITNPLKAVARAGAGVNNVPVGECTQKGVVVFNTPGANANAVKELVLCGLLLGSRGVIPGIGFATSQESVTDYSELSKLVEAEKKRFKGNEIAGKTLGVVGLGAIGSMVADMAIKLGMKVQGFDPALLLMQHGGYPAKLRELKI